MKKIILIVFVFWSVIVGAQTNNNTIHLYRTARQTMEANESLKPEAHLNRHHIITDPLELNSKLRTAFITLSAQDKPSDVTVRIERKSGEDDSVMDSTIQITMERHMDYTPMPVSIVRRDTSLIKERSRR